MRQQICSCSLVRRFHPSQLGVGVTGGCEAAVHATRRFLTNMPDNFVVVNIDLSNAFNYIRRDSVLAAVSASIHAIYRLYCLANQHTSILQYGQRTITSEGGVQQGDPLGSLLFRLTVQPLLFSLASDITLVTWMILLLAVP